MIKQRLMKNCTLKILTILLLSLLSVEYISAQDQAVITYDFYSYGGYEGEMKLYIKDGCSKFVYVKENKKITTEEGFNFYHYAEYFENYYNWRNNEVHEQRKYKKRSVLIAEWENKQKWKILQETKKIGGYQAQKAITNSHNIIDTASPNYYGNAVAWFTTELPFHTGPFRYYGLPGLIVKLEFTQRRNIIFLLRDIDFDQEVDFEYPDDGIKVSREEIIRPHSIDKEWLKQEMRRYKRRNSKK